MLLCSPVSLLLSSESVHREPWCFAVPSVPALLALSHAQSCLWPMPLLGHVCLSPAAPVPGMSKLVPAE